MVSPYMQKAAAFPGTPCCKLPQAKHAQRPAHCPERHELDGVLAQAQDQSGRPSWQQDHLLFDHEPAVNRLSWCTLHARAQPQVHLQEVSTYCDRIVDSVDHARVREHAKP